MTTTITLGRREARVRESAATIRHEVVLAGEDGGVTLTDDETGNTRWIACDAITAIDGEQVA